MTEHEISVLDARTEASRQARQDRSAYANTIAAQLATGQDDVTWLLTMWKGADLWTRYCRTRLHTLIY